MDFNLGSEDAPEEDAEYDHLDGEEVSAFNMKDEEAEGFNAATGEILPRKTEDDEVAEDPWLLSLQHEEVRCRVVHFVPCFLHVLCRYVGRISAEGGDSGR